MYVSEYNFEHLLKAENERFTRELELRRIARERSAGRKVQGNGHSSGWLRQSVQRVLHPVHAPARHLSHS